MFIKIYLSRNLQCVFLAQPQLCREAAPGREEPFAAKGHPGHGLHLMLPWGLIGLISDALLPFVTTWMELEEIVLKEISQGKERLLPYDFTHMWDMKKELTTNHKQTHRGKQLIGGDQRKRGVERGQMGQEIKCTVMDGK